jgi:sulfite exporter TauE/SafE
MTEYIVAFVTGLTTGGLSCLAVQGGLLASSLASQVEQDVRESGNPHKARVAQPILWFLLAKLIAYTILGFMLGWLGSVLQLNPITRAVLQIAIGIFMVGQALRMLNVHPIFRYFNIEPPKFITRFIRRKAKNGSGVVTPLFMGALTVLIPCGITQVMMASAITTGNAVTGALLMFSFILGTSPIFFIVAYFTTRLGEKLEKYFMRFVAVVVLVLGLITVNTGLNLMGSPLAFGNLVSAVTGPRVVQAQSPADTSPAAALSDTSPVCTLQANGNNGSGCGSAAAGGCPMMSGGNRSAVGSAITAPSTVTQAPTAIPVVEEQAQELVIQVENNGYSPEVTHALAGVPTRLVLVSNNVRSCSLAFVIPSLNVQVLLEPTGSHTIEIPAQQAGTRIPFSCSMGMYTGVIIFDK